MTRLKSSDITVREFALLTNEGDDKSVDCHSIPKSAFEWLLANGISSGEKQRELVKVKRYGKSIALQVVNFVGVLETPCRTRIEILPKTTTDECKPEIARKILLKMLASVDKLKLEEFQQSHLQLLKQPLYEVLIAYFLKSVAKLIKQGIRSEFQRVERESSFLKGQLLVAKQLRQRPGRQHYFQVSHDIYHANRAENRLLHSSLKQVFKWARTSANQRLARELLFVFSDIQESADFAHDFRLWTDNRSLAHYRPLKPWCELILSYQSPVAMAGNHNGLSFLFPMEQLFERYVAKQLKRQLPIHLKLREQVSSHCLTHHNGNDWFRLKPDIVVYDKSKVVTVMDTKWKLLDASLKTTEHKYNLNQSDMYQLFAYGEKYLKGQGDLYLIYPKHTGFTEPLANFEFKPELRLHVVPYDLETDLCYLPEFDLSYSLPNKAC